MDKSQKTQFSVLVVPTSIGKLFGTWWTWTFVRSFTSVNPLMDLKRSNLFSIQNSKLDHTSKAFKMVKLLWQKRQKCKPMPEWIFLWGLMLSKDEKCLPQIVQMYRCCPVWQNGLRQCPCWLSRSEGGGRMSWMGIMLDLVLAIVWVLLRVVKLLHMSRSLSNGWLESLEVDWTSAWTLLKMGFGLALGTHDK